MCVYVLNFNEFSIQTCMEPQRLGGNRYKNELQGLGKSMISIRFRVLPRPAKHSHHLSVKTVGSHCLFSLQSVLGVRRYRGVQIV